ncbi:hypothetical protein Tco_1369320 [Tanacetum coccineum]
MPMNHELSITRMRSLSTREVNTPRTLISAAIHWGVQIMYQRQVIEKPDIHVKITEHSIVTYTSVSIPVKDDSDIGSPRVDGPPIMPEDPYAYIMAAYQVPPSPDYIPGPEEPQSPPPLDFFPEPMYPEYIPQEDEILSAEEQPLPAAASPTADSPGYVPESNPEEEQEEDDEDPEEDLADYPADKDDDDEEDEEEEEEHPAPANSVPPVHRMTARISIRISIHITVLLRKDRQSRDYTTTGKELGIDLGPRYEIGESSAVAATRPVGGRRADYGFVGTMDTEIRRRRAEEVGYGIRDVWIDPREAVEEVAPMTLGGVNARVTELTAVQEQDTQDIYAVIEDTQDRQTQIYQSVETLFDDSQYHYETARLLDQEALVSREAWGRSIEVSYMTRSEILALRSVVMGQQAVISQLQAADRKSQVVTLEMLQADYQRQVQLAEALKLLKGLQTQMVEFQRQHGPAKGPAQPDAPGEAGSSS